MCKYQDLTPDQQAKARTLVLRQIIGEVIETRGCSVATLHSPLQIAIAKAIDECGADEWSLGMTIMAQTYYDGDLKRQTVAESIHQAKDRLLAKMQFVDGPVITMAELNGESE